MADTAVLCLLGDRDKPTHPHKHVTIGLEETGDGGVDLLVGDYSVLRFNPDGKIYRFSSIGWRTGLHLTKNGYARLTKVSSKEE